MHVPICMLIKQINKIVMGWDSWMISRAHSYPIISLYGGMDSIHKDYLFVIGVNSLFVIVIVTKSVSINTAKKKQHARKNIIDGGESL